MSNNPDVFIKKIHAPMVLEQVGIDFPEVENKEHLVEFVLFLMNKSYWEGVARALGDDDDLTDPMTLQ